MSGQMVALPASTDQADWTPEEKAVVEAAGLVFTHTYGQQSGTKVLAPRAVVAKFFHTVDRTGLDPLAKQIYCIGRASRDGVEWAVQTGIDGFRLIAERTKQYAGQDEAEWLTEAGSWVPVFVKALHGTHPLAARVRVYRHDWSRPAVGVATWDEYAQSKNNGELTKMWEQRGPGQLAKCAEALALRKAFPQDLSGLYTDDEMGNATALERDEAPAAGRRGSRGISTVASRARAAEAAEAPASEEPERAAGDAVGAPEQGSEDVALYPCARCGESVVEEEGSICPDCEVEVEREIAEASREGE
jgi:phage recombination protein Bet